MALCLSLSGRAEEASKQIPKDSLQSADGIKVLFAKLDALYLPSKHYREFTDLCNVMDINRTGDMGVLEFINDFDVTQFEMVGNESNLSDYTLGLALLRACKLTREQTQHALSMTAQNKTYEGMKEALRQIFLTDTLESVEVKATKSNADTASISDNVSGGSFYGLSRGSPRVPNQLGTQTTRDPLPTCGIP